MQLIDPTVPGKHSNNRRAPPLQRLDGLTIGLLSNGKLNADNLLNATANQLQQKYGGKILPIVYKANPSAPAPAETLSGLSVEADYLITATGD
ncbi:MAG: hypothetical protein AAF529_08295 [Pseudomonadota bacterium]